ncbi:hypothetical protein AB8810_10945 [Xanthomonas sp. NCPPB 3005]|uniref:hypothetical protein n=1 Tax=Xanthomonas sp. NCPPB 3005 TaxID=3240913 RepID=UPI003519CBFE
MTAQTKGVDVPALPRVEQRRWSGPNGYSTVHWVVLTADGELRNDKQRVKKFRSQEAANAAMTRVCGVQ